MILTSTIAQSAVFMGLHSWVWVTPSSANKKQGHCCLGKHNQKLSVKSGVHPFIEALGSLIALFLL